GRSIVANAGVTLYTVGTNKKITGVKNYISVDGSMADNPRYALYESPYTVVAANRANDKCEITAAVVGRCCESGDFLQDNVNLPDLKRGDILAFLVTGAYNHSMASNYNRLLKPAMVMIKDGESRIVIKRETYEDLMRNEI
ncbi:MAG: diaminopimelate decarboxylase, partial [Oscillospiraceae bacterium]|nr:diaminopimelate decarboxylase [Oscillospiraceae bacterium]